MASYLRYITLALVLAYSVVFGPASAVAAGAKVTRQKASRFKIQKFHFKVVQPQRPLGDRAAIFAKKFIGVPYRWAGSSPSTGFDCSGFVRYVYSKFGVDLPHSSYADFNLGQRISRWSLKPGDLVFFNGVGHVGLYVGNGRFIHAPHTGTHVQISTLGSQGGYDGARRIVSGAKRLLLHG